jgi:hypothetical protein
MNQKKQFALAAMGAVFVSAMLSTQALAKSEDGFSGLQGVEAQALSSQEMSAVSGKLNAYDIAAALTSAAAKLAHSPKLQAADLRLAAYFRTNAVAINALFQKYGVLTACRTCNQRSGRRISVSITALCE